MQYSYMLSLKYSSDLTGDLTIQQVADEFRRLAEEFEKMARDGVIPDPYNPAGDGYIHFVTEDEIVAARYGFEPELCEDEDEELDGSSPDSWSDNEP